jgi:hypothetical protein
MPASPSTSVKKVLKPRFKELSFSFRAECMVDVAAVFSTIFKKTEVLHSLCQHSAKSDTMFPDVDVVLVFRLYDGHMDRFVNSIKTTLDLISDIDGDVHVINETIHFTSEYDGQRTYTGEQRDTLMDRLDEKLAEIPFTDVAF